jgi:hypothetical protein
VVIRPLGGIVVGAAPQRDAGPVAIPSRRQDAPTDPAGAAATLPSP